MNLLLTLTLFAQLPAPIVDTATAIELNTTINGAGEELFTQILIWEGKELRYVHFWGECDEGTPFGFVVSDKPGEVEVYLRSLTGPRIVTAPKLIRSFCLPSSSNCTRTSVDFMAPDAWAAELVQTA